MSSETRWLDFELLPALEAREPPEARGLRRDEVRLLVSDRRDDRIAHAAFGDLPAFLCAGDLVVVNDSATLPGALPALRADGSEITLHLSNRIAQGLWIVEPRQAAVRAGERLSLPAGGGLRLIAPYRSSSRLWVARLVLPVPLLRYLNEWGRPIAYKYVTGDWPIEMYQNVYASRPGSAEMPSAGRAFTPAIFAALEAKGVRRTSITLHTGVASLEGNEEPYEEWFSVGIEAAEAIAAAHARGGRVIAVGTTVVRALESASDARGRVRSTWGWTDLVVTPARGVRTVDALLTGFHEPRASHLAMLEALAGRRHLALAYRAAIEHGYLWHEFGDVHLIL